MNEDPQVGGRGLSVEEAVSAYPSAAIEAIRRLTAERDAWRDLALARSQYVEGSEQGDAAIAYAVDRLAALGIDWRTGEHR